MNDDWADYARVHLTLRKPEDLATAIASASDDEVLAILHAFRNCNFAAVSRLAQPLFEKLDAAGRDKEAITIALIDLDSTANLVQVYTALPPREQPKALRRAIEASDMAMSLAGQIRDIGCYAFYLRTKAQALYQLKEFDASRELYANVTKMYRGLAAACPYGARYWFERELASTLIDFCNVLNKQHNAVDAQPLIDEAVEIGRRYVDSGDAFDIERLAGALMVSGNTSVGRRDLATATNQYQEAVNYFRRYTSFREDAVEDLIGALSNLASVQRQSDNLQCAKQCIDEVVVIASQLAKGDPNKHESTLLMALNNLGNLTTEMRQLDEARSRLSTALDLVRRMEQGSPELYAPQLACTLSNFANLLDERREYELARARHEEAIVLHRTLATSAPEVYQRELASSLVNLSVTLSKLRDFRQARKLGAEAVFIYQGLASEKPHVYSADLADCEITLASVHRDLREYDLAIQRYNDALALVESRGVSTAEGERRRARILNGLGNALRDSGKLEQAKDTFTFALQAYRSVAAREPQKYAGNLANALNNLALTLQDQGFLREARSRFAEALELLKDDSLRQIRANTLCWLATIDQLEGSTQKAITGFEASVSECERSMGEMGDVEHRDLSKRSIEYAYAQLIDHHAAEASGGRLDSAVRVIGLIESLRQVAAVSDVASTHVQEGTTHKIRSVLEAHGTLSETLRENRHALVWSHMTERGIVFAIVDGNRWSVEVASSALGAKLFELLAATKKAIHAPSLRDMVHDKQFTTFDQDIKSSGEAAYSLLPKRVQELLSVQDGSTVFLSPCAATANIPFELIRVPVVGAGAMHEYLGIRRVLPRVNGLDGFVSASQPAAVRNRTAVVVGDPHHHGFPHSGQPCEICGENRCPVCQTGDHCGAVPLKHARMMATKCASLLRERGFRVIPDGNAVLGESATSDELIPLLCRDLGLWVQMGHGCRPDEFDGIEYLALAHHDRLIPDQLAAGSVPEIVHLDCCQTGTTRYPGGGRFAGFPATLLRGGSRVVLASVHPLWDDAAGEFSDRLYQKLLAPSSDNTIGDALLATQREMATEYEDNPLTWATTVLWGSPYLCL